MGKAAQKAQIIGDINMTENNKLMETLKASPMQNRETQPFPKFTKWNVPRCHVPQPHELVNWRIW